MTEQELAEIERHSQFAEDAIKNGVLILYDPERVNKLIAEARRLRGQLAEARSVATGLLTTVLETPHHYMGLCPDGLSPAARDDECPACQQLIRAELAVLKWGRGNDESRRDASP